VVLPPQSPNLNAYCERFVRSIKEETLDQMVLGSRPAAAPQRSLAALSCAPVSHCGSPAARSRGLLPVTPRQACPVAPAMRPACCRQGALPAARRGVGEASGGLHNPEGAFPTGLCGKIAFEIPILAFSTGTGIGSPFVLR